MQEHGTNLEGASEGLWNINESDPWREGRMHFRQMKEYGELEARERRTVWEFVPYGRISVSGGRWDDSAGKEETGERFTKAP